MPAIAVIGWFAARQAQETGTKALAELKLADSTLVIFTSDHGELLGAHGGLHQKWFNLYDEATRVPFLVARTGTRATAARARASMAVDWFWARSSSVATSFRNSRTSSPSWVKTALEWLSRLLTRLLRPGTFSRWHT